MSFVANAQETPTIQVEPTGDIQTRTVVPEPGDNKVYAMSGLQVSPEYPGGTAKLKGNIAAEILKNAQLPKDFKGRLMLNFVVEKDGTLSGIRTISDNGHKIGLFAERFMRGNKVKWSPGVLNGVPVRTLFYLPVEIKTGK